MQSFHFPLQRMLLFWLQDIPTCEERPKNFRHTNAAILLLVCLEHRQDDPRDCDRGTIQRVCEVRTLLARGFGGADIKTSRLIVLSPHQNVESARVCTCGQRDFYPKSPRTSGEVEALRRTVQFEMDATSPYLPTDDTSCALPVPPPSSSPAVRQGIQASISYLR